MLHQVCHINIIYYYYQNIVNTAYVQVNSFLDQWKTYVTHNYNDYQSNINNQLEAICLTADKICEEMNKVCEDNENNDMIIAATLKVLEKDTITIANDVNSMIINYTNEDKMVKNNIQVLQSKMMNECKKQVGLLKDHRNQSSKQQGHKLLHALKGM